MRIAFLVVALAACTDTQPSEQRNPPLPPPSPTPQARLDGARPLHMSHCPSSVPGAITTSTPSDTGVDVTITAPDQGARNEILALATETAKLGDPKPVPLPGVADGFHSGRHTGGGVHGFCPIIHAGTAITVDASSAGVIIHERPYNMTDLAKLRRRGQRARHRAELRAPEHLAGSPA